MLAFNVSRNRKPEWPPAARELFIFFLLKCIPGRIAGPADSFSEAGTRKK
jgi:hypothetical protein